MNGKNIQNNGDQNLSVQVMNSGSWETFDIQPYAQDRTCFTIKSWNGNYLKGQEGHPVTFSDEPGHLNSWNIENFKTQNILSNLHLSAQRGG